MTSHPHRAIFTSLCLLTTLQESNFYLTCDESNYKLLTSQSNCSLVVWNVEECSFEKSRKSFYAIVVKKFWQFLKTKLRSKISLKGSWELVFLPLDGADNFSGNIAVLNDAVFLGRQCCAFARRMIWAAECIFCWWGCPGNGHFKLLFI